MAYLYYIFTFVVALALMPVQLHLSKKHVSVYYTALFMSIAVTNFGYLQLGFARNVSEAIYANQIIYLGACFIPFFSFLCMADLIKYKIPRFIKPVCFTFSTFIFFCACTIGHLPLYYKNIQIDNWSGVTFLIKQYGPLHALYPAYNTILALTCLYLIIKSFKQRRQISYVTSAVLLGTLFLSLTSYLLERVLKMKVDLVPICYNIEQIAIVFLLNRISLYDVSGISAALSVENNSSGFIVFKTNGRFIGWEGFVQDYFPEVNNLQIDQILTTDEPNNTDFLKQINKWIHGKKTEDVSHFNRGGKTFKAQYIRIAKKKREKDLHIIQLTDDTEQEKLNQLINRYNEELEKQVDIKTDTLNKMVQDIIAGMGDLVENRDNNTGGHVKRTSDIMAIFVKRLKKRKIYPDLTKRRADRIVQAASLHDLGKIGVPDTILNKPGKFEPEEYDIMKTHSEKGAKIVEQVFKNSDDELLKEISVNIAHYHHEKWNGKGYPEGLKQEEIPFEARVMALADVFDALVSKRVYKDQYSYDRAFTIIEESSGEHFDPTLCTEFLNCRPQLEELYNKYSS